MSIPRPLLVFAVVLVVLGLVGCMASVGLDTFRPANDVEKENELDNGSLADVLGRLAPPSQPLVVDGTNSTCPPSGNQLAFNAACTITIADTPDLRRSLVVRVSAGQVRMNVVVTTGGKTAQRQRQLGPTEEASLVVARGDEATVVLTCLLGPCAVLFNP